MKNIHNFKRIDQNAELKNVLNQKPDWVDVTKRMKYQPLAICPIQKRYPDISATSPNGALKNAFKTFNDAKATYISEGEVLYRVLDSKSADNSICWMRESEYKKLKTKGDWRRCFAVFASWNSNGEYLEYTKFQC